MPDDWLNDDQVDTTGIFHELIDYSQNLPYDVTVPMSKYFGDISVEPYLRHYEDRDGFQLRLQFRNLLEDEIELRAAKIRLVTTSSTYSREIWLESLEPIEMKKGLSRIWLDCKVSSKSEGSLSG